jgi:hypothetical protein
MEIRTILSGCALSAIDAAAPLFFARRSCYERFCGYQLGSTTAAD